MPLAASRAKGKGPDLRIVARRLYCTVRRHSTARPLHLADLSAVPPTSRVTTIVHEDRPAINQVNPRFRDLAGLDVNLFLVHVARARLYLDA